MKYIFENIEKIENSNLYLEFNKKINLKERFFLNFLVNSTLKKQNLIFEIDESFFKQQLKENDIERFLKLFFEKKIVLKTTSHTISGIINLISCFIKKENKYIFFISETLYNYLNSYDNIILKSQLELLIKLDNDNIKKLYFYLLITFKKTNTIILTKKEIKNILNLDKEYTRFFDLEIKFILPTLKLIKETCNFDIKYEKKKGSAAKNSKISTLNFVFPIGNLEEENQKILSLLSNYPLNEETKIFALQTLVKTSFEYVQENINYFKDHVYKDFNNFLLDCLKYDLSNTYFKNLLTNKLKNGKILVNLIEHFDSIKKFEKILKKTILENSSSEIKEIILLHTAFKEIIINNYDKMAKNKKNNFLYDYNELLYQLENLQLSKEFLYEDPTYIYIAEFNSFKESFIYIIKKENSTEEYLNI